MSTRITFITKANLFYVIPKFAVVKRQFINEVDSLTTSRKFMTSHLPKHMQDLSNLSMQYYDLKSLLCSNVDIVFGNTLINIAQRSISKCHYLSFKTKNQGRVNLVKKKKILVAQIILFQ